MLAPTRKEGIAPMSGMRLTSGEREFFLLISLAAFANPFSEERDELDLKIADLDRTAAATDIRARVLGRLRDRLDRLRAAGRADLGLYESEDRSLLEIGFLFDSFHRFSRDFDALIRRQEEQDNAPCAVPFVEALCAGFAAAGFAAGRITRSVALLYQLQRAYYFIDAGLVGASPSMKQLRLHLWNNVFTRDILLYERYLWNRMEDFSTLLLGETGTGKGTAAAAIGRSGFIPFDPGTRRFAASFTGIFLPVNLALYPESLIESELFGHRKGAFTGAVDSHRGIFSRCSFHGSIFLDEIGDVPPAVQVKLLQVLQERVFSPVGSHERQRFAGRVIAATNRPLDELRRSGLFRDDFYYRLSSDCVVIPTLRQRLAEDPGELDLILGRIISRLAGDAAGTLVGKVREAIDRGVGAGYSWPGNVRELEQTVRRILLTGSCRPGEAAGARDETTLLLDGIVAGSLTAQELLASYCASLHRAHGTYEEVARRTGLDRRTVRKYIGARRAYDNGAGEPKKQGNRR